MRRFIFILNLTLWLMWETAPSAGAQGIDPVLAARFQLTLDSMRQAGNYRGASACILYPGMGLWTGVSGVSHPGVSMTPQLEFGIASNTKLFAGVLLLKLAEAQLLDLDDSLHSYLPAYPNINPNIRIRQLLNHTSGLFDVTSVPGYPDSILINPNRLYTPAELMTWTQAPLFAPGTGWNYCNTNYLLAGMIAESVTGQPFGRLLRDSILTPLQLDSTFLDVYDSIPFAVAHPWQGGIDNFTVPRRALNSAAWAAGAMYSTPTEMVQWYHALLNGQVVNAASLQDMTSFVGSGNYGIGISKVLVSGRTVWTHGGNIWGGYNSSMMYDTATGAIFAVFVNHVNAQANQFSIRLLNNLVHHPVMRISGSLRYANATQTPMTSVGVQLTQNAQVLATDTTTNQGHFDLGLRGQGTYPVQYVNNRPWGGVNATDALLILRHFGSTATLTGIYLQAADVNVSGTVNATDALLVSRRFTNTIQSLPSGDWIWEVNSLQTVAGGTYSNLVWRCLAAGDVNGSYQPPVN